MMVILQKKFHRLEVYLSAPLKILITFHNIFQYYKSTETSITF